MVNIITYIEKKTIDSFFFTQTSSRDYFISLNNSLSVQVANKSLEKNKGHKLDGVVFIEISNHTITSFMDWDDIDFMWIGILEMILDYKKTGFGVRSMAMNSHEWSFKRILTKPENKIIIKVKRNPLLFEGTNLYETYKETKMVTVEKVFLTEIIKAAKDFISFREKLIKMDSLSRLKALIFEINAN
ncbi:hypothetical protein [Alkalihalobacillus trypoxylicola]|uniref:Uncharacterized protein n=1 Tax=Alkalihalobacillus trypoxylicola TaxID=519424 RepID=A0A162E6V6_9BACI|nr:hypothetical protein [Alkalihalobacillus trypoxylicola]KYG31909.1 hypothetical protein AZF04_03790 [Alkalihalobacillus trypoxylicola]